MSNILIPDQPHIDEICMRLWSGREIGKAAVMVGAGFSRNARCTRAGALRIPLLQDLANEMFDTLYPAYSISVDRRTRLRSQMTAGTAIMNLASEFETIFGRQALNDLLMKSIADDQFVPDVVHELLLSLPWSDVFTTNYDTLLERTRPLIHNRKYDLIHQPSDIPGKMKPRIVKLHGTFPSHTPFIITDEDYRTFPRLFPPFVNIVQQSIMENAFCLLGFSGNDPNFIYWSGWVRDYLGDSAAPIYLCGVLNLTPPQRRMLERRNVIPIDLTPVVSRVDAHDEQLKHRLAIEWFLRYLAAREPLDKNDWPRHHRPETWVSGFDLPPVSLMNEESEDKFDQSTLDEESVIRLSDHWRRQRNNYPGWVVLPYHKRITLWQETQTLAPRVMNILPQLPCPHNVRVAYELSWRAEKCLTPISDEWAVQFESICNSINPFPRSIAFSASVHCDSPDHRGLPWEEISECWVELVFALLRRAREDQDKAAFDRWITLLRPITNFNTNWQSRWYYEQAQFCLFSFKQAEALKLLEEWPHQRLSFWEARRSALLAELGEVDKGKGNAERLLSEVRNSMRPYDIDYSLLSQEAWLMLQLFTEDDHRYAGTQTFQRRWNELKTYEIDPWFERNTLQSDIQIAANKVNSAKRETVEFDPLSRTVHYSLGGTLIADASDAYSYLRLFEEGAIPMRVGTLHMATEEGALAGRLISPFSFFWALSAIVRSDKDAVLYSWLDRVRIATLEKEKIDRLSTLLIDALKAATEVVSENPEQAFVGDSFLAQNFETFSELVSRLCFRMPQSDLESLLLFTVDLYRSPSLRRYPYIYRKTVDVLLKRIAYALPPHVLSQRLDLLLALPVANEAGFEVPNSQLVNDPFAQLEWPKNFAIDATFDRSPWNGSIARLIELVRHGDNVARERAIHRLLFVDEIGALRPQELISFRDALWSRLDEKGFPANRNIYLFTLLRFQPPTELDYSSKLQQKMLNELSPTDAHYFQDFINVTASATSFENPSAKRLIWNEKEALALLLKAQSWWQDRKSALEVDRKAGVIEFRDRAQAPIRELLIFLGRVVLPNIQSAPEADKAAALRILDEIEQAGYTTLMTLPLILAIAPDRLNEVAQRIRTSINSSDDDLARDGIFGLYRWYLHTYKNTIAAPPPDMIIEWANKITFRRQPALLQAIIQMAMLVDRLPSVLSPALVHLLSVGLEYLLTDTQLPTERERLKLAGARTTIAIEERPDYRAESMRLAGSLQRYCDSASQPAPDVLTEWRKIADFDPLPEVRYAWTQPR